MEVPVHKQKRRKSSQRTTSERQVRLSCSQSSFRADLAFTKVMTGLRIHGFASEGNPFLQATGGGIAQFSVLYKNPSQTYAHVHSICWPRGSAQLLSLHKFRSRGHEMRTYPRVRTEKHHTSKPKQKKRTSATEFDVVGNNQPQELRGEPEQK